MTPFEVETRAGSPIRVGQTRLIPFTQTIRVQLPGMPGRLPGGMVWRRPTAILAQSPDGRETVVPIRDITRQAQLTLFGLGLLGTFLIWFIHRKTKRSLFLGLA